MCVTVVLAYKSQKWTFQNDCAFIGRFLPIFVLKHSMKGQLFFNDLYVWAQKKPSQSACNLKIETKNLTKKKLPLTI